MESTLYHVIKKDINLPFSLLELLDVISSRCRKSINQSFLQNIYWL